MNRSSLISLAGISLIAASASAATEVSNPFAPITTELTPDGSILKDCNTAIRSGVMELDRAGSLFMRFASLKFTPGSTQITIEHPDAIHTEPDYTGQVGYAKFTLGGEHARDHWVAIEIREDESSRIFADLNADGDLTNDGNPGDWDTVYEHDDKANSFATFFEFQIDRVAPDGGTTTDPFGINIYWTAGTARANFYRGGAAIGEIEIDGKTMPVALVDEGHTGDYRTGFAIEGGYDPSDRTERRFTLMIGNQSFDARGSINYNGMNYVPRTSLDGRRLILEPTPRVIEVPLSKAKEEIKAKPLIAVGEKAPFFEARTKEGETFELAGLVGEKVIVLDFWATWCGPCMSAMPHLVEMKKNATGEPFEIVALNVSDTETGFKKYANAHESDYGFVFARDPVGRSDALEGIGRKHFGVTALPTTIVIDREGIVRFVQVGFADEGKPLMAALNELGVHFED